MERKIIYADIALAPFEAFKEVLIALKDGWILDPTIYQSAGRAQPMRLDNAVIYHLAKFSAEELETMKEELPQPEQITDVIAVAFEEVKAKIAEGYVVHQIYAKNVILKRLAGGENKNGKNGEKEN